MAGVSAGFQVFRFQSSVQFKRKGQVAQLTVAVCSSGRVAIFKRQVVESELPGIFVGDACDTHKAPACVLNQIAEKTAEREVSRDG